MNKKTLFRWLKVFVLVYCVVGIAIYYGQERLIFHPVKAERNSWYHFDQPSTELNLNYDSGVSLNIVEFKATDRPADSVARGVVLFFHGNAGNTASWANNAPDFTTKGYEVWMIDYPGYGKSTGALDEQAIYKYSLVFYKLARSRWQPGQIILCGRSLGTGIATQLASARDCRRLILEAPYYDIPSLFSRRLPLYPYGTMLHFHFPTYRYLPTVTAPVTIFHGDQDGTIPASNSEQLKAILKPGDEYILVPGAGHNDLTTFPAFRTKLDSLLK